MKITVFIFLLLLTINLQAADKNGKFQVHGIGFDSCSKLVVIFSKDNKRKQRKALVPYRIWLRGYLTSFNALSENTFSLESKANATDNMVFIEEYCRENPLDAYFKAVLALTEKLYPERTAVAPVKTK